MRYLSGIGRKGQYRSNKKKLINRERKEEGQNEEGGYHIRVLERRSDDGNKPTGEDRAR
jgi:hypothetical protein